MHEVKDQTEMNFIGAVSMCQSFSIHPCFVFECGEQLKLIVFMETIRGNMVVSVRYTGMYLFLVT